MPPVRSDIEAEIAFADERRLRGDRDNRADGAATVLRWLIDVDDHVPVRGPNRGELVGGSGDVVRSPQKIAEALAAIGEHAQLDENYLSGVITTWRWATQKDAAAPISGERTTQVTARHLKAERILAEDVVEQARYQVASNLLPPMYCVGARGAINWLLGDSTWLNASCSGAAVEPCHPPLGRR